MLKILYVMHIDWDWIKQRPQYLAEELAKEADVHVVFLRSFRRPHLGKNNSSLKRTPLVPVPWRYAFGFAWLDSIINTIVLYYILISMRPDVLWLTHPLMQKYIPQFVLSKLYCVYDVMDDHVLLRTGKVSRSQIARSEAALVHEAELMFASSEHLRAKLLERYGSELIVHLIRNGVDTSIISTAEQQVSRRQDVKSEVTNQSCSLLYIGTVSHWIDYPSILDTLKQFPNLVFHFAGPPEHTIEHERVKYLGVWPHERLPELVARYDILIMPFIVNEMIASVDPVKLYEYVSFHKPIIASSYPEIERFSPFVEFYSLEKPLAQVVRDLLKRGVRPNYELSDAHHFLGLNSWRSRVKLILKLLNSR
ncbi:glycosyltransferase family 1 protein [Deinococcus yavapaiensis]|uniref:Glycosyltransferase involved in cell wall biosynthesis n=1 Tax=Deinococcus yavapaiensis KR-236 TaxID=694435 RepID=A0A318SG91_9DEIO|nr:glycosyltransferase family 1 protein [Deinococcus yavapaiensis]PYE55906.1 glycosyltransferase involved in cell wall biosynthesis [Deinococcus yavapaiensis KR-236]